MQLELFKLHQVDKYNSIEKVDVADVVDPTTGKTFAKNIKRDTYYLYKTGCFNEILKDKGNIFPGVYSKLSGKWLNLHPDPNKYVKFTVDSENNETNLRKKINFHRLVASAFIVNDDPKTKKVVHHINKIKYDNRLENLSWSSQSENSKKENITNGVGAKLIQDEIKRLNDNA
jgi:hypothetical protein